MLTRKPINFSPSIFRGEERGKCCARGAIFFEFHGALRALARERPPLNAESQEELMLITAQILRNVSIVTDFEESAGDIYARRLQTAGQLFYPTLGRAL